MDLNFGDFYTMPVGPRHVPPRIELARVFEVARRAWIAARDRLGEPAMQPHRRPRQRGVTHHVVPVAVREHHRVRATELSDPSCDRVKLARKVRGIDDDARTILRQDGRGGLPDPAGQDIELHTASLALSTDTSRTAA